jgi:hypothetical protein
MANIWFVVAQTSLVKILFNRGSHKKSINQTKSFFKKNLADTREIKRLSRYYCQFYPKAIDPNYELTYY